MELKLFNAEENFVVESMCIGDSTVEFVHDTETGKNFFTQRTMRSMLGLSRNAVSRLCNNYEGHLKDLSTNCGLNLIRLKTSNKGRKTSFYGFNALTYLAFRINTPKAIGIQNTISSTLNKMFNVVTGKDSINSNKSWLKQQCEVVIIL